MYLIKGQSFDGLSGEGNIFKKKNFIASKSRDLVQSVFVRPQHSVPIKVEWICNMYEQEIINIKQFKT